MTLFANLPFRAAIVLAMACPLFAGAQTTSTSQIAPHHTRSLASTTAKPACPAAAPALALPAGVPPAGGAVQTLFALRSVDIKVGTGELMPPGAAITVHYTGWLASDGTKFDSSVDRGTPFQFTQGTHQVIAGWDQGFAGMRVGGKRRLFIPYQLAYGEDGRPPAIPAKSDLIFDVELIADGSTPAAPAAAPPAQR